VKGPCATGDAAGVRGDGSAVTTDWPVAWTPVMMAGRK